MTPWWLRGVVTIILSALALSQSAPIAQGQTGPWVAFRSIEFKFHFLHPPTWQPVTPRGTNVRASINGPPGEGINCNVVVRPEEDLRAFSQKQLDEEIAGAFTADDWRAMFAGKFPDGVVISSGPTKVDNRPAQIAVVTYSYATPAITGFSKSMVVARFTPGRVWIMGCGVVRQSKMDAASGYARLEPIFHRVISSVVFE